MEGVDKVDALHEFARFPCMPLGSGINPLAQGIRPGNRVKNVCFANPTRPAKPGDTITNEGVAAPSLLPSDGVPTIKNPWEVSEGRTPPTVNPKPATCAVASEALRSKVSLRHSPTVSQG